MQRYHAFLFDLDGTLIDSIGFICETYAHTLRCHELPAQPREYWTAGVGRPLREQLRPFATGEAHLDALVQTYRTYNDTHHDAAIRPFPGVRDALARLHAQGRSIAVVTSKHTGRAQRGLEITGLAPYVHAVIGAEDTTRHKPDPEPVLLALARLEARASDAVMVGDSVFDVAAGRAAGTATAGVVWGACGAEEMRQARPDHLFERPEDLLQLAAAADVA
jgi:pyrophosphatase PpaX